MQGKKGKQEFIFIPGIQGPPGLDGLDGLPGPKGENGWCGEMKVESNIFI